MSESTEGRSPEIEDEAPTHFIIKVQHKGQDAYALCASVLLVEQENLVGISANDLDAFIEKNAVRAAGLLRGGRVADGMGGHMLAGMGGRSVEGMGGRRVSVSIDGNGNVINVNDPTESGNKP